jgi:hypothetical protein
MISTTTTVYSSGKHASFVIKNLGERKDLGSNYNAALLGCILVLNAQVLKKGVMRMYVYGERGLGRLLLMLHHLQGNLK